MPRADAADPAVPAAEMDALRARLREAEGRLAALAENGTDLICELDGLGRFLYASPSYERLLGYRPQDLLGTMSLELIHPEDLPAAETIFHDAIAQRITAGTRCRMRRADGRFRWMSFRGRVTTPDPTLPPEQVRAVLTGRDVSAEVAAEERLRETNALYRDILDHLVEALAVLEAESDRVLYVNPAFERIYGLSAAEVVANPLSWIGRVHPEDRERIFGWSRRTARAAEAHEYRIVHPDGRERWIRGQSHPIRSADGTVRRTLGVAQDVTEERERRALELQLVRAQKLESLGLLAGGVAHDFNNLLAVILGNVELARQALPAADARGEHLAEASRAAERAALLTQQLLAFAGAGPARSEPLDLSAHVRELLTLLAASMPKKLRLSVELGPDLPPVDADPARLQQVVMNLVLNAAEAVGDAEGHVRVRTGRARLGPRDTHLLPAPPPEDAPFVFLEVEDDGAGMSEELAERIFEPFFTTKPEGHGLGLAAVMGVARGHGGCVALRSAPGRGTCFRLLLPEARRAAAVAEGPGDRTPARADGTVLVVDDEPSVRRVAVLALRRVGFEVVEATDGREAVDRLRAGADRFDLVLLDLSMPGLSGEEVYRELRTARADLPVLFTSGHDASALMRRLGADVAVGFLHKPYRPDTLASELVALRERATAARLSRPAPPAGADPSARDR